MDLSWIFYFSKTDLEKLKLVSLPGIQIKHQFLPPFAMKSQSTLIKRMQQIWSDFDHLVRLLFKLFLTSLLNPLHLHLKI